MELAEKLERLSTPTALKLAREMRDYVDTFIDWELKRPDSVVRSDVIQAYLTKVREVMDYLAKPSSPPPG